MKEFKAISVNSKFGICGLPIRIDTYKTCSFGCEYCFANNRKVMGFDKELQVADVDAVERRLNRIFNKGIINENSLLDVLIADGIDWHLGGMSDPLQPAEAEHHITKKLIEVTNKYGIHMVISTKSDNLYGCDFRPDLHSFQLSVSNVSNCKAVEPNVPDIQERYKLYRYLKDNYDRFSYLLERCIIDIKINESMISQKEVLPHEKNKVFFDGISFCRIVIFIKCNSTCKRIRSLQTLQRLQGLLLQLV